jgi:uncharacterized protein (TIGR03545 family)
MRWKALIPIVIIIVSITIGFIFFINPIFKSVLISNAQKAVGAKVEIQDAKLKFKPLGIDLKGIVVADKNHDKQNLFEVGHLQANLRFKQLLKKKIIIDTIEIKNVSFASKRKTSGKLNKAPKDIDSDGQNETELAAISGATKKTLKESKDDKETAHTPDKQEPSAKPEIKQKEKAKIDLSTITQKINVDEIIEKQKPKSIEKADEIQAKSKELEAKWSSILDNMKFSDQINALTKDVNNITKIDFKDLKKSEKDIKATLEKADNLKKDVLKQKNEFEKDYNLLQKEINQIKKLGDSDYKNLSKLISADTFKLENITSMLLGEDLTKKISKVRAIIKKAKKYLPIKKLPGAPKKPLRRKGWDISFPTNKITYPGLLIKTVNISGTGKNKEQLKGFIKNITSDQAVVGKPTELNISGKSIFIEKSRFTLNGTIDNRTEKSNSKVYFDMENIPIKKRTLYDSDNKQIRLISGTGLCDADFIYANNNIDGIIDFYGSNLKYESDGLNMEAMAFAPILFKVLNKSPKLKLKGQVSGPLLKPNLKISSDIDKRFSAAINDLINQRVKKAQADLKKKFDKLLKDKETEVLKALNLNKNSINKLLAGDLSEINKNQNIIEEKKEALENKAKAIQKEAEEKLRKERAKLEQAKRAQEAKAKKQLEEEKARIEKEAETAKKQLEKEARKALKNIKLPF